MNKKQTKGKRDTFRPISRKLPWQIITKSSRQSESENKTKDLIKLIQDNRQVEGKIRRRQISLEKPLEYCNGALDCQVVKTAVQDIMEGSEMAFTKRKEKYGF